VSVLEILIFLALAPVAVYALAILLRVACYYRGVEIPALGRAFFTAFATSSLSLLVFLLLQFVLVGGNDYPSTGNQFVALLLALSAHVGITTGLYVPLLGLRYSAAFSVWLAQAVAFAVLAIGFGSCLALPWILF
jgi:hypothetical protein